MKNLFVFGVLAGCLALSGCSGMSKMSGKSTSVPIEERTATASEAGGAEAPGSPGGAAAAAGGAAGTQAAGSSGAAGTGGAGGAGGAGAGEGGGVETRALPGMAVAGQSLAGAEGGQAVAGTGTAAEGTGNPATDPRFKDPANLLSKRVIYFDFDSSAIREEFRPLIEAHAKFLKDNQNVRAVLQGHTDERGSRDYNLALGQRRSESVKQAMSLMGVQDDQMEAVSLGEEKPVQEGHDESAWQMNRRTEIHYLGE